MDNLKRYKIFESQYKDLTNKILDYKSYILKVKEEYKQKVIECMFDISDNYDVECLGYDEENNQNDELEIFYEVKVGYDKLESFFSDLKECNHLIKSFIGKSFVFEHLGRINQHGSFENMGINNRLHELNKMDIDTSLDTIKEYIDNNVANGQPKEDFIYIILIV